MFRFALPASLISFVMYGFFPMLCNWIKLVATENPYKRKKNY